MAKNIADLQKRGIQIVAISVDSAEESRKLMEKRKLSFPLLSDPERAVISQYGVADSEAEIAVPSVFFVEQGGTVSWVHVGEVISFRPSSKDMLQSIDGQNSEN